MPIFSQTRKSIPTIENKKRENNEIDSRLSLFDLSEQLWRGGNYRIECRFCQKGIATGIDYLPCENCKDWTDSYRNVKGCNVCKNNKYIKSYYKGKCNRCGGTGVNPKAKKVVLEEKLYNLLGIDPTFQSFTCAKPYLDVKVEDPLIATIGMDDEKIKRLNFVVSLIKSDQSDSNIYFLLACIMTGDRKFSVVKTKLYAMLEYYNHKANLEPECIGDIVAIKKIKLELAKLEKYPGHKPKLLDTLTAEEILLYF